MRYPSKKKSIHSEAEEALLASLFTEDHSFPIWGLLGSIEGKEKANDKRLYVKTVQLYNRDGFTKGLIAPSKNIAWVAWKLPCWLAFIFIDRTICRCHIEILLHYFNYNLWGKFKKNQKK